MTMTVAKTLKENAAVRILFSELKEGYLFGEDTFIHYENGHFLGVYIKNENENAETAFYQFEKATNVLGLDLKESESIPEDVVKSKILSAIEDKIYVMDFSVISEGDAVIFEGEAILPKEEEANEQVESSTGFAEALARREKAEPVSQIQEETAPASTESVAEEAPAIPQPEEKIPVVENPATLTRDEKREICKAHLLSLFTETDSIYKLASLYAELKEMIDFDISITAARNYLIDLTNEGKLEVAGHGKFQRPSFEQISLFQEEAPKMEESAPTQSVVQPVSQPVVPPVSQPAIQPVSQPVIQPAVEPVPEPVLEQEKPATDFSQLFYADEEVQEYLTLLGVPEKLIAWAIEFRSVNRERFLVAPQNVVNVIPSRLDFLGNGEILTKSLATMKTDLPLSLKGPAGTGKTTLVETICAVLNMPNFSINGSLESNKGTLVGESTIKQRGIISVKDGQMQKAAIYGGMLYVDEINMMRPDMLSIIHGYTDHRKSFQNDVRGETTFLHKNARFISAMNEGYTGTKQMNKATIDRNVAIELDYMSKQELKNVLTKITSSLEDAQDMSIIEQKKLVEQVANFYSQISQKAKNGIVPDLAGSTRSVIQLLKLVPLIGFQMALEMIFAKFTKEEADQIKGALLGSGLDSELGVDFTK